MPNVTPQDFGVLARGYDFRLKDGRLVVSNDRFYALAISRFGGQYDLVQTIGDEAEWIINDVGFLRAVESRAIG